MKLVVTCLSSIVLLSTHLPASAYPPPCDPLTRIHYDFEVASYCGLIDDAVGAGFNAQLAALLNQIKPETAVLNKARSDAWQAAYQEWQNRGLGGFKAWCKKDGQAAALRFQSQ